MLIKDLIQTLQEILDEHDAEYVETMGEPTIYIDVFAKAQGFDYYQYCGIDSNIEIQRTRDGVNLVLSAFVNPKNRKPT